MKNNQTILILVIAAIIVSVIGTIMLLNATSPTEIEQRDSTTGQISLAIAGEQQEYHSTGMITLDIVGDLEENSEE